MGNPEVVIQRCVWIKIRKVVVLAEDVGAEGVAVSGYWSKGEGGGGEGGGGGGLVRPVGGGAYGLACCGVEGVGVCHQSLICATSKRTVGSSGAVAVKDVE